MKKVILTLIFAVMTITSVNAMTLQIIAVVNDDIITSYDFYNRVNMALVNTGLPKNKDSFNKITPIVMQELIEESLKVQAANDVGLIISEEEINQAIMTIAQRNNMEMSEFNQSLLKSGIEIDTLKDQIEANMLWGKYVNKKIFPRVDIPEEEVDEFIKKLADNEGEQEYLIEEIFYPVDSVEIESSAEELLEEILIEIKQEPESFSELAARFSKAPNQGRIGWVLPDTLSTQIREVVVAMDSGEVSPIIRTLQGFSIIKLAEKRTVDNQINKINKEALEYKLAMEKVEILQKRQMRDLKETAFIEVKIK